VVGVLLGEMMMMMTERRWRARKLAEEEKNKHKKRSHPSLPALCFKWLHVG
jgi:hypothetical protein